jgi:hypothetical protein
MVAGYDRVGRSLIGKRSGKVIRSGKTVSGRESGSLIGRGVG